MERSPGMPPKPPAWTLLQTLALPQTLPPPSRLRGSALLWRRCQPRRRRRGGFGCGGFWHGGLGRRFGRRAVDRRQLRPQAVSRLGDPDVQLGDLPHRLGDGGVIQRGEHGGTCPGPAAAGRGAWPARDAAACVQPVLAAIGRSLQRAGVRPPAHGGGRRHGVVRRRGQGGGGAHGKTDDAQGRQCLPRIGGAEALQRLGRGGAGQGRVRVAGGAAQEKRHQKSDQDGKQGVLIGRGRGHRDRTVQENAGLLS